MVRLTPTLPQPAVTPSRQRHAVLPLSRAGFRAATACILLLPLAPKRELAAQDTAALAVLPAVRVNALRSGMVLQRAPVSAAVIGAGRTQSRGPGLAVGEALHGLGGLVVDDRHNQALGERFSIRGFGARSTFGIRGIRVLVDGIPATMPDGQTTLNHVEPGHIVGAELVRGAAGAFLGNAAGGALHLRTGTAPGQVLAAAVGGGFQRRVSVSGASTGAAGYATWQRQQGFRAHNESERAVVGGVFSLQTSAGRIEAALHGTRYMADNPGSLTAEQVAADPTQANPGNVRQRTFERGTHAELGAGWAQTLGRVSLELRGHVGIRSLLNPIPPRIIELDRSFGGVRAQAGASGGGVEVQVGAELEALRDERVNFVNEEGSTGALVLDQRERVRGAAVFLHALWSPAQAVTLFLALRRDGYRFSVADALVNETNPDDSGQRTLSATSAAGGAGLRVTRGLELFANLGTAFETPTTTELANRPDGSGGFNPELEPERTLGGEAGLRAELAEWRAEATLFRADVSDKLIPFEVPALPGRQFFRNAGRARHQGLELSANGRPLPPLELRAAYSRLDVRFREYVVGAQDYSGQRVPGVAGHRLDLEAELRPERGWRLLLRARRNGSVPATDGNEATAPAYTLLGARTAHQGLAIGTYRITPHAGVENLLDESYTAAVAVNAAGARYYEPGPGRYFYFGLTIVRRDGVSAGTPADR